MITVNELIEKLQKLKNKGYGELPCIYSSDDEGNSYHIVYNKPSEFLIKNIEKYELTPDFKYDEKGNVIDFEPNCVIIN